MAEPSSQPSPNRRARVMWVRRALLALAGLFAVILLAVGLLPKPVPVEIAAAARGPMTVTVDEEGKTRVRDRYVVSAPVVGFMPRITLDPGDRVKQGEVLARIVPLGPPLLDIRTRAEREERVAAAEARYAQAETAVKRARAALEQASREASRQRVLADRGAVAPQQAERAELARAEREQELAAAAYALEAARHDLDMARAAVRSGKGAADAPVLVRAPVAGEVLKVAKESAGPVALGARLIEIGDPRSLEIVVDVLTTEAVNIVPGDRVLIERWGGPMPLEGHVARIEPSAFSSVSPLGVEEQRVNVIVAIDTPHARWKGLGDGFRVETRTVTWRGEDVLQIPASAVFRHGDGWAVYRVAGRVARLTPVKLGHQNDLRAEILHGLRPGARVVIHPSDQVHDGARVRAR